MSDSSSVTGCEKHEWPTGWGRPCPDCAELKALKAELDVYRTALESIEWEGRDGGNQPHLQECEGNHPAYCCCTIGKVRRLARHALDLFPKSEKTP